MPKSCASRAFGRPFLLHGKQWAFHQLRNVSSSLIAKGSWKPAWMGLTQAQLEHSGEAAHLGGQGRVPDPSTHFPASLSH